jgi:hypothetical protein
MTPMPGGTLSNPYLGVADKFSQLENGTYQITVLNNFTQCKSVVQTEVVKNATPVFITESEVVDQYYCANSGHITVTKVEYTDLKATPPATVTPPITDFDFTWTNPSGGAIGVTGQKIDSVNYPAIGSGVYQVFATRKMGTAPGSGCQSAPVSIQIKDKSVAPSVVLTPFSNTSCTTAYEGSVLVDVTDASPSTPNHPIPPPWDYNYTWTTLPTGAIPAVTLPASMTPMPGGTLNNPYLGSADNFTQLQEGTYQVTVLNNYSKCQSVVQTEVIKNATPVFVTQSKVVDQYYCANSGHIDVIQVQYTDWKATPPATVTPPLTDFTYTWADPSGATIGAVTGKRLDSINYSSIKKGVFSVYATRNVGTAPGAGCKSAPVNIEIKDKSVSPDIKLSPLSNTSCAITFEGEIKVDITDASGATVPPAAVHPPWDYNYTWATLPTGATPAVPLPLSMTPMPGGTLANPNTGLGDNYTQLQEGTYQLTVLNNYSQCQSVAQVEIIKNGTPVFTQNVIPTPQTLCSNPANGQLLVDEVLILDRSLTAQSTKTTPGFHLSSFGFKYDRVIAGVTTTVLPVPPPPPATAPDSVLNTSNYAGIGFGTYYVTVTRTSGSPGLGCSSAPYKVDIDDKRVYPTVSLTPFANTSCDSTFFEGEIKVVVNDQTTLVAPPLGGFTYAYHWPSFTSPPYPATATPADFTGSDGDGYGGGELDASSTMDNDGDHPTQLHNGSYTIVVTNEQTQCPSQVAATTIYRNSTPVFTQSVQPLAQIFCYPFSDASLEVKQIIIKDNKTGATQSNTDSPAPFHLSAFGYKYERDTNGVRKTVLPALPATTSPDSILNKGNYAYIGVGTYYVTATRTNGAPGLGCSSPPYKVDIDDQINYPKVDFHAIANSSCNINGNGLVTAIASENTNPQIPSDNYDFVWTLNSGAIIPPAMKTDYIPGDSSSISNALSGAYIVTVTNNNRTGCSFSASYNLALDTTRSKPSVIDVLTTYPKDCNPSAGAKVTKITLGSTYNSSLQPPLIPPNNEITDSLTLDNFKYEWYYSTTNPPSPSTQLFAGDTVKTRCVGANCPYVYTTNGLVSGTYFVSVVDTVTSCKSNLKEFEIKVDSIIHPVVSISQPQRQIACDSTKATAILLASAREEDGTVGNYTFQWYHPRIDTTGTKLGGLSAVNPNQITNVKTGNYSIRVVNTVTSCTAAALFIVPPDTTTYAPVFSTAVNPRTWCVGSDADARAIVHLNAFLLIDPTLPAYPLSPYDNTTFKVDLYNGWPPSLGSEFADSLRFLPVVGADPKDITYDTAGIPEGKYTFVVKDRNTGCVTTDTLHIKLDQRLPGIKIDPTSPQTYCDPVIANGQIVAYAIVPATGEQKVQGYNFRWFTGTDTTSFIPGAGGEAYNILSHLVKGDFTVKVTDDITKCVSTAGASIEYKPATPEPPTAVVLRDQQGCFKPDGSVAASVGGQVVGYTYDWTYDADGTHYYNPEWDSVKAGLYIVVAKNDVTHCTAKDSVTVLEKHVLPKFIIESTPAYCKDTGGDRGIGTFTLTPEVNVEFAEIKWTHGETPADTTMMPPVSYGPVVFDLWPGVYYVSVTTSEGCKHSEYAVIGEEIKPYNLVSPNSNNANNQFVIDCISDFPNNNVKIFNRSGTLVYEMDGYATSPEKYFRGVGEKGVYLSDKDLPEGTYFYIIDKRNGTKPKAGFLELVR